MPEHTVCVCVLGLLLPAGAPSTVKTNTSSYLHIVFVLSLSAELLQALNCTVTTLALQQQAAVIPLILH